MLYSSFSRESFSFLKFSFTIFLFSTTCAFSQLEAELIDNEGWIKGNFVEIGINNKGVYGANTSNRPSSFHDNRENDANNLFGFIANPQKDNWIDYDGDYFTPGDPEEGFSIEIDGVNYNNNNTAFFNNIDGEVVSASIFSSDCFEDYAQIVWSGEINGLRIRRFYSITEDGLFIQMITNITNISSEIKNDVFFLHNVDPDNNQTLSGIYDTNNLLVSQASSPTDNISLVKASQEPLMTTQDMDGSHVSFYSKDERARVTFGGFNNRDASNVWNGLGYTNTEGSSSFDDIAISIAFNFGDINPSESLNFTYYYILEEVDESFEPLIVNIIPINPSICENNDGKFIISGLIPSEVYQISYNENNVAIPLESYTANSEGVIEIVNLVEGTFSGFSISYTGCTTTIDSEFELTDPPIYFNLDKVDPTNCNVPDGKLIINDLVPATTYFISYDKNSVNQPESSYTSDANGRIEITNLSPAVYNNILVKYLSCETPSDVNLTISHADSPVFSLSKSDPTSCDGSEGVINITGLLSNTEYNVSYIIDGNLIEQNLTTNNSGVIQIINLITGTYENVTLDSLGCITNSTEILELEGPINPIIGTITSEYYCDEDHDYIIDGLDLSIFDIESLNGLPSSQFSVSYHKDEDDTINNIPLPKTNYSTIGLDNYMIYARVTNNFSNCFSYIPFEIYVNIPADFELYDDTICLNSDDTPNIIEFQLPIIETNISEDDYNFQWYLSGAIISSEISSFITVNEPGTYEVVVTNKLTGCAISKSAEISPSGRPKEYEITITSDYFSSNHTVEITTIGHGDYEYSIDGIVQDSPIFENILIGFHDFCIIDKNGCGNVCEEKIIIDYMKFFSPNNDNNNDKWRIIGSEFLINAQINIFDRFGKVLAIIDPNGEGWDGIYNGVELPSTDYWFTVEFDDNDNNRRIFRANFSLIRR